MSTVDISDLSRWYDSSEIKKLNESQAGRRVLAKIMGDKKRHRKHKDKIEKIKSNKRRQIKSVEVKPPDDSSTLSDRDRRMVTAVITGMSNASKHNSSMSGRVIRTKKDSTSTDSAVTFDHLGNPL